MTLDEAIKHCKKVAKNLYNEGDDDCTNCANEHEQLAEWLEELKAWRELKLICAFDGYVIYKDRSEVSDISKIEGYCDTCKHNDGYPTSEVCQWCGAFHHYEKGEENEADN